ncbi:hypothetical protein [Cytobacillus sp.]|uniref:hypothetical protein n=1 Tax=Cytobacillus sp. TaxID=2675269 RepID=UPI0028BD5277|nr:hypothetical protein [Cytobacillus sp.]
MNEKSIKEMGEGDRFRRIKKTVASNTNHAIADRTRSKEQWRYQQWLGSLTIGANPSSQYVLPKC